jgi:hypothetical protein
MERSSVTPIVVHGSSGNSRQFLPYSAQGGADNPQPSLLSGWVTSSLAESKHVKGARHFYDHQKGYGYAGAAGGCQEAAVSLFDKICKSPRQYYDDRLPTYHFLPRSRLVRIETA